MALLELEEAVEAEASEARLDKALLRASPVALVRKVVEMVVAMLLPSLIRVETIAEVTSIDGTEVTPTTPPIPERVVVPVDVTTVPPELNSEVQVLVVMALGAPVAPSPLVEAAELASLARELAALAAELARLAAELARLAAELAAAEVWLTTMGGMGTLMLA